MMKDGVINIDKPAGWTSHDVVAKIRALLKIKKVGHTGTLDPEATGVLPICFGKGTKIVSLLVEVEKEYDLILRLGEETETEDATGRITRTVPVPPSIFEEVPQLLKTFVGTYEQIPPMYSAVKVKGVPLYRAARAGRIVERKSRRVTIHDIRLKGMEANDISLNVVCSKGTYIRTLCADIGARLGVGGHLFRLRRVRSGKFHLENAVPLDRFCGLLQDGNWEEEVYSLNEVLTDLPAVWVKEGALRKIQHGAPIGAEGAERWEKFEKGASIRLLDAQGNLVAIGSALIGSERLGAGERFFKIQTVLSEVEESSHKTLVENNK